MNYHSKSVRLMLAAGVALSAIVATPALAQDAGAQTDTTTTTDDAGTGEIVVTARRRAEKLIDVPIAVTALTGDQLEKGGAIDITDVAQSAPNVSLEVSRGTNSTLSAFIRGVGQQDPVAGFEPGVGIYLDDIYLNRPQAAVVDIYDVERIEVLRGPQGTLYGRNTIGGAVKYVTRRLSDKPTLRVKGTYGTFDQADLVVTASAPIGDSGFRIGASGARLSRGGFGKNLSNGAENYNKDIWAGRGTLEYAGSDTVFVRVSGDYTDDRSLPRGGHRLIPGIASGTPVLPNVFDSQGGLVSPTQNVTAWGVSGLVEIKPVDGFTFRSITGYRKDDSATPIDFDALPAVDVDVPAYYNNKQFSQEFQGLIEKGSLNGLVGVYYLNAEARTVFDVRLPGGVTALTFGNVKTNTWAVFGDFTYNITPSLSLSAGGRYTWDERKSTILRQVYLGGGSPYFGGTGTLFATTSNFTGKANFQKFTPRVSVAFKPSDDQNVYFSWSKGFKGGGFDPRGQSTACRTPTGGTCNAQQVYDFLSFAPENVTSYELGYKAALLDRRLNLALSLFRADYTDVQVPGSIGTTVNGIQTFIGITTNAGSARLQGIELEGNAVLFKDISGPGDAFSFNWAFGYLDAKYLHFIDSRGIDVAKERKIQNTPDVTFSGTFNYHVPAGDEGSVDLSTTASYRSASQQFELRTPLLDQPGYTTWDANVDWTLNKKISIGLHVRNLTDKKYIVSGYNFLSQNPDTGNFNTSGGKYIPTLGQEGVLTAYYGNPRQIFVTVNLNF